MTLILKDNVKETTASAPGTSSFSLNGAVAGKRSFADIGNANQTMYTAYDPVGQLWEVGLGTYTLSGTTLSRDPVLNNSSGTTSKISFANAPLVWCDYPSEKAVMLDGSGNLATGAGPLAIATPGSVTAAATTDLSTSSAQVQTVSGNTTITSFGTGAGLFRTIKFTGSPLITYNATSLITPTGANIQAAPGDVASLVSDGSGKWTITDYTPAGGVIKSSAGPVNCSSSGTVLTSIALTPGKWRLTALVIFDGGASVPYARASISMTAATGAGQLGVDAIAFAIYATSGLGGGAISGVDYTVTSNTTYYLNVTSGGATDAFYGNIPRREDFLMADTFIVEHAPTR